MPSFDGRLPGLRQSGWSWVQVVEGSRSGSDWGKKAIRCKSRTSKRQVGFRKCDLKFFFLPLYFTKHLYKELLFGTFFFSYQFLKIPHTRVTWLRLSLQTSLQPCSAALRWRRCHPLTVFFAFLTISKRFSLRATLPTAFCFDWLTQAICIQLAEQWRKKKTMNGICHGRFCLGFHLFGFVYGYAFTCEVLWDSRRRRSPSPRLLRSWPSALLLTPASFTCSEKTLWPEIEEKECSN